MNSYRLVESAWLVFFVAFLAAVVYGIVGCTPAGCIKPIVTIERPVLPTITALELEPISGETYLRLRTRDVLLHQYAETLELTIRELAEVAD